MGKGIYMGLGSVLFLAFIAALAVFNSWQASNTEQRVIEAQQSIRALEARVSALDQHLRRGVWQGPQAPTPPPESCPGNLLHLAEPFLPEGARQGGTLRRSIGYSSKGFNPLTQHAGDVIEFEAYVGGFFGRYDYADPNRWIADLATCVMVNDDFTEYTIKLRQDVLWHPIQAEYLERSPWLAGEHRLTADDFMFAMQMIKDPAVEGAAPLRNYFEDLERVEKLGDFELRFVWKKKTFQSLAFTINFAPVPRWVYAFDPDGKPYPPELLGQSVNRHWYQHMMGTGPYRFVDYEEGSFVKLERNPAYHGEPGAFDEIVYRVIKSSVQQVAQFEGGELDYVELPAASYKEKIRDAGPRGRYTDALDAEGTPSDGRFGYAIFPRMSYRYLGWNADRVYFADARVRRAMTMALDRELLLDELFMGLGVASTGPLYVKSPEYDDSIQPWPYDPVGAAALLDEAGWKDSTGNGIRDKDGVEFTFTMLCYDYRPEFIAMAEYYKEQLKALGVEMSIQLLDWPALQTRMNNRDFDVVTGGWGLSWHSDAFQIWHSSQADLPEGSNRVGFRNAEADRLIETLRETFDPGERAALFHRFHRIVHEEQPYTFLFADLSVGVWQPNMRNMVFQSIRPHDLSLPWYKALP
ncbi:MAG: ABC transporter substrate-binding protein [Myxococcota bacterium]|jgi:ABC-type transport system substrate-binding protein|nr:ABC transporter substrate-binding protein [Myxococcota bacterium]